MEHVHLRDLFAGDPSRGERLTATGAGLYLDYSKHRVTDETLRLLVQLAEERGLRARIEAMFRGEKINVTEQRAVLHVALRAPRDEEIAVDGENVVPDVHEVLDRMAAFADEVRDGGRRRPPARYSSRCETFTCISMTASRLTSRSCAGRCAATPRVSHPTSTISARTPCRYKPPRCGWT